MKKSLMAICAVCCAAMSSSVHASEFDYGDFMGTDVMYLGVTENTGSEPAPLFGAPDINGNKLDFDPTNFFAEADNANPSHIVDSQLNFTLMSNDPGFGIDQVFFEENGDYSLAGLGTALAEASVGAVVNYTVTHINGSPANVPDGLAQMTFTPANGMYDLANHAGTAVPWQGSLNLDIAQFLVDNNIAGQATKIEFAIDNTLVAEAANGGSSFIRKKDFNGLTVTVPEPGSMMLLSALLGCSGLLLRRR